MKMRGIKRLKSKTNSPEGLKFAQLRSFEREGQNCSFNFELGYGWEEDVFPLF